MKRRLGLAHHPSASTAGKLVGCAASHVLEQTQVFTAQAEAGTDNHEARLAGFNGRKPEATAGAMGLAEKTDLSEVLRGVGFVESETAYIYNAKTRKTIALGKDIKRAYAKVLGRPLEVYEFPLTIDLQGFLDGVPWSGDLKYGVYSDPWQFKLHAMALCSHFDTMESVAGPIFVDSGTGHARAELETYFLGDLDAWSDVLVAAWDKAAAADPADVETTEGPWCTYCGALPHCPSKMRMVRAIGSLDGVDERVALMTPEERGKTWARVKEYQKLLERIEDALKDVAAVQPLPLPNGKQIEMRVVRGYEYPGKHETTALLKRLGVSAADVKSIMKRKADHMRAMEVKP